MVSQSSLHSQSAPLGSETPSLMVDAMLGRLARWLRLAGYDTEFWREGSDDELIAAARSQGRLILTKDRALAGRRGVRAVRIDGDALDEQMQEARAALERLGPAPKAFTRCSECNGPVEPLARADAQALVQPYVWHTQREFRRCVECGRVYWKGTHWPGVQARLAGAAGDGGSPHEEGTEPT